MSKRQNKNDDALLALVHSLARRTHNEQPWCCKEELLAAGFEGLSQALTRYDETRGASITTFAFQRVRGAILDEVRRQARSAARTSRLEGEALSKEATPHEGASRRQLCRTLRRALMTLPDRHRALLLDRYYADRTLSAAGRRLGISRSRATRVHQAALLMLRERLAS